MTNKLKKRSEIDDKYKWDLSLMYKSEEQFEKEKEALLKEISELEKFKGHITDSASTLYDFIILSESSEQKLEDLYVYSQMDCDSDSTDSNRQSRKMLIEKLNDDINNRLSFATPEILSTGYEKIKLFIDEDSRLEKYKFFLKKCLDM